mmetsp:Transcript_62310/g.166980  ORF Transcript_62310/g.166980 Transcript_62310/m.166980 type:complete len:252 (-) Transcript_62310:615-1370(-)
MSADAGTDIGTARPTSTDPGQCGTEGGGGINDAGSSCPAGLPPAGPPPFAGGARPSSAAGAGGPAAPASLTRRAGAASAPFPPVLVRGWVWGLCLVSVCMVEDKLPAAVGPTGRYSRSPERTAMVSSRSATTDSATPCGASAASPTNSAFSFGFCCLSFVTSGRISCFEVRITAPLPPSITGFSWAHLLGSKNRKANARNKLVRRCGECNTPANTSACAGSRGAGRKFCGCGQGSVLFRSRQVRTKPGVTT